MKTTETKIELAYGVTQIKTKSLTINEPDHFPKDKIDILGEVALNINTFEDASAEITFEIISNFVNSLTNETLVAHIGLTKFKLINAQSIFSDDATSLLMPDQLMVTLYGMAHSHARALLAAELKHTIFKDEFFIPLIDPTVILNHKQHS